jgi:NAD-dependent dihydropyrimidine dehydrogenase PreA subunit
MTEEKKKQVKMKDVQAIADEKNCPVQRSLVFVEEFLAEPMCGRCFPCSMGSYEARIRVKRFIDGTASEEDIEQLKKISSQMSTSSMCKKGKDTAAYLAEQLETTAFSEHIAGLCAKNECSGFLTYLIIQDNCTMCGDCLAACKDFAIYGEKAKPYLSGYMPFEIAQERCTKCGECIKVCKYNAIITKTEKELKEAAVEA